MIGLPAWLASFTHGAAVLLNEDGAYIAQGRFIH
jgi:hypothetical protein